MPWNDKKWQSFLDEFTEKIILIVAIGCIAWWGIERLINFFGGQ
jgi:hypothetical protein